jgi:hypothetical protein
MFWPKKKNIEKAVKQHTGSLTPAWSTFNSGYGVEESPLLRPPGEENEKTGASGNVTASVKANTPKPKTSDPTSTDVYNKVMEELNSFPERWTFSSEWATHRNGFKMHVAASYVSCYSDHGVTFTIEQQKTIIRAVDAARAESQKKATARAVKNALARFTTPSNGTKERNKLPF